jgi:hypothetical protein
MIKIFASFLPQKNTKSEDGDKTIYKLVIPLNSRDHV